MKWRCGIRRTSRRRKICREGRLLQVERVRKITGCWTGCCDEGGGRLEEEKDEEAEEGGETALVG